MGRGEGRLTLVVVNDVSEVILARVVGFADAHGVVGKVDIAVVALGEGARSVNGFEGGSREARTYRRVGYVSGILESGKERLIFRHLCEFHFGG